MKVSIITVTYNCEKTIADTILSVAGQDYANTEHIIIDGASTDRTPAIIETYKGNIDYYISEPDRGIYHAMNKGISRATGDIVGVLNGDDVYFDRGCIASVVKTFEKEKVAAVCGNVVYVTPENLDKIVRFYKSENFKPHLFSYGMMPAHPGFFVLRECYHTYGLYREDFQIAADFELLLRFLKVHGISYHCFPGVLVKMRTGGVSTQNFKSNWILNKEILTACKENHISTNIVKLCLKYFIKIFQLVQRPV